MKLRIFTTTALAALAVAAPASQAAPAAPDTGSASSAASHYTPAALKAMGARYRAMANLYNERRSVDGSGNAVPTYPSSVRPDDRAGVHGVGDVAPVMAPVASPIAASPGGAFSWGDAGLGAGATLLIVAGLLASTRFTRLLRDAEVRT